MTANEVIMFSRIRHHATATMLLLLLSLLVLAQGPAAAGTKPQSFGTTFGSSRNSDDPGARKRVPAAAEVTGTTGISSSGEIENEKVCLASGNQISPAMVTDGGGGALVTWQDARTGSWDIYAQRLDFTGRRVWGVDGVPVCKEGGLQTEPKVVTDGAGGMIVVWTDQRPGTLGMDIFAQRLTSEGAPVWAAGGVVVCNAVNDQKEPSLVEDGAGGVLIMWRDFRTGFDQVWIQRVNGGGVPLFAANGVPVNTVTGVHLGLTMISDGHRGAIVTWQDDRADVGDIRAQRINEFGTPMWLDDDLQPNGIIVCLQPDLQGSPTIVEDGVGGAIIAWADERLGPSNSDIYVQRIDAVNGARQWVTNGLPVCTTTGNQVLPRASADGAGGALITWQDGRPGPNGVDIYAQRVNAGGFVEWAANGVGVCTAPSDQLRPELARDPNGGSLVAWSDSRSSINGSDIYVQHLGVTGTSNWTANGVQVCDAAYGQDNAQVIPDGSGGAITSWRDARSITFLDIYAQKVLSDGTLPVGCAIQTILGDAVMSTATGTNAYYDLRMIDVNWTGVAVRSAANTDWDIEVYGIDTWQLSPAPGCYISPLGGSYQSTGVDFVALNCNGGHTIPADPLEPGFGVRVTKFAGAGNGTVEWERGFEEILEGSNVHHDNWNHVIENWDLFMLAGKTYKFNFTREGAGDIKMFVFGSEGTTGNYVVPRSQRLFESAGGITYFLAPASEFYGVIFVNENGLNGNYEIRVDEVAAPVGVDGQTVATGLRGVAANPAVGRVKLEFGLREAATVSFDVIDMAGRVVARIPSEQWNAGTWSATWDGRRTQGTQAPAGIYFVKMRVDGSDAGLVRVALLR